MPAPGCDNHGGDRQTHERSRPEASHDEQSDEDPERRSPSGHREQARRGDRTSDRETPLSRPVGDGTEEGLAQDQQQLLLQRRAPNQCHKSVG